MAAAFADYWAKKWKGFPLPDDGDQEEDQKQEEEEEEGPTPEPPSPDVEKYPTEHTGWEDQGFDDQSEVDQEEEQDVRDLPSTPSLGASAPHLPSARRALQMRDVLMERLVDKDGLMAVATIDETVQVSAVRALSHVPSDLIDNLLIAF